jgi:hypothetical protein
MIAPPKKIWMRWGRTVKLIPGQIGIADKELDHEYVRRDLVQKLIELMEDFPGFTENAIIGDKWVESMWKAIQDFEAEE